VELAFTEKVTGAPAFARNVKELPFPVFIEYDIGAPDSADRIMKL